MTVQEIHEYIWDKVVDYCDKHAPAYDDHDYVHDVKVDAINELRNEGKLTWSGKGVLITFCACVLCAIYDGQTCVNCPLYKQNGCRCHSALSDFHKVQREFDVEAAKRIRDVDVLNGDEPNKQTIRILEEEDYVQD